MDTVTFLPKSNPYTLVSQLAKFLDEYPKFKLQYIKGNGNVLPMVVDRSSEILSCTMSNLRSTKRIL